MRIVATTARLLIRSRQDYSVELIGPVLPNTSWQAVGQTAMISRTLRSIGNRKSLSARKARKVSPGTKPGALQKILFCRPLSMLRLSAMSRASIVYAQPGCSSPGHPVSQSRAPRYSGSSPAPGKLGIQGRVRRPSGCRRFDLGKPVLRWA
jgi:hypothetical protein